MQPTARKMPRLRRLAQRAIPASVRGRITLGFGLLVMLLVAVGTGSLGLMREYKSSVADVERTSTIVHHAEGALADGSIAFSLLQSYVSTGDETELDRTGSLLQSALAQIREARKLEAEGGESNDVAQLDGVIEGVQQLEAEWQATIALRQQGDEAGAEAALADSFAGGLATYDAFAAYEQKEQEELTALRERTSMLGNLAFWLLVTSGVAGVGLALGASILIARSVIRPLTELELATQSVAGGDLAARAHVRAPRELASLAASLNQMTEALLDASKRRELEEERGRAYQQLKESEESYRALAHVSPALIFNIDTSGSCLYVNERWRDLTGLPEESALGHGWVTAVYPEDRQRVIAEWTAATGKPSGWHSQFRLQGTDGGVRWVEGQAAPRPLDDGTVAGYVGTLLDVTQRKQVEIELRRLNSALEMDRLEIETLNRTLEEKVKERTAALRRANQRLTGQYRQLQDAQARAATDALTGLGNHRTFQVRVRDQFAAAQREGARLGLIMLDVDGFKSINDSLGHLTGDDVLRDLATKIANTAGHENSYRYGGDEFAVLLPGADEGRLMRTAERLRRALSSRYAGKRAPTTVSLGTAIYPSDAASAEELIYGADAAMYWAKSAGKNRVGDWGSLAKNRKEGIVPWFAADRAVKEPETIAALVAALAAKDPETSAHTERCSWYSARLAEELGLDRHDTSIVRLASLLHDVGKIAVPDGILCKPGSLSEDEWSHVRRHPVTGLHILGHIRSIADATPAVLHHHEHFDGSGYPDGLSGADIPVASRILLVTDAFDAMTTDRPYRKAMPVTAAVEELKRNSGSQFDPAVVDAFLRVLERHGPQPLTGGDQRDAGTAPASRQAKS